MAMYRECPYCGAFLDPGETCDCRDEEMKRQQRVRKRQAEAVRLAEFGFENMYEQEVLAI